jgi:hypothetical protein
VAVQPAEPTAQGDYDGCCSAGVLTKPTTKPYILPHISLKSEMLTRLQHTGQGNSAKVGPHQRLAVSCRRMSVTCWRHHAAHTVCSLYGLKGRQQRCTSGWASYRCQVPDVHCGIYHVPCCCCRCCCYYWCLLMPCCLLPPLALAGPAAGSQPVQVYTHPSLSASSPHKNAVVTVRQLRFT